MNILSRRRFLQGVGLGALASAATLELGVHRLARADDEPPPQRLVLFCTAHSFVWRTWHVPLPGLPTDRTVERELLGMSEAELSPSLRPLHALRDRILPIEGLSNASVYGEWVDHLREPGTDFNNHTVAGAHFLTAAPSLQRPGSYCTGGAISIDQEIGRRLAGPGRFGTQVWGASHGPYSFLGSGEAAPRVDDPERIYADLLGLYVPPIDPGTPTRETRVAQERASAVDAAAREYEFVLPRLGVLGRRKLERHRDLLRDRERTLDVGISRRCDPTFAAEGHVTDQYAALTTLALSCDLARVITLVPPVLAPAEFGFPADTDVHTHYAHSSVDDAGEPFSMRSEEAMTEYAVWYARRFANLLEQLDAVPEAGGSLLDHTAVAWLPELGSPTHQHHDACAVIAGGSFFFRPGRYVRYARDIATPFPIAEFPTSRPFPWSDRVTHIGPSRNQLFVTLLRAFGGDDDAFNLRSVPRVDGSSMNVTGTLAELHR